MPLMNLAILRANIMRYELRNCSIRTLENHIVECTIEYMAISFSWTASASSKEIVFNGSR